MAYAALPTTKVTTWTTNYANLAKALKAETDGLKKPPLEMRMQALATTVEKQLNKDIDTVQTYFTQHSANVDRWHTAAQAELKRARANAADFAKHLEKTELAPQIAHSAKKLKAIADAMKQDARDYGQAWFGYRGFNPPSGFPAGLWARFGQIRSTLMAQQKALGVKIEEVEAAQREAEALVVRVGKYTMKSKMKAGTGTQRPTADAQKLAKDLADELAALLSELRNPTGKAGPNNIKLSATSLANQLANKTWTQKPTNQALTLSSWKNAEALYKTVGVTLASMEKVYAAKKRGLRSNELTDPTVKAELKRAEQSLKAAKADAKKFAADYNSAKSAYTKLEAQFKSAAKKK